MSYVNQTAVYLNVPPEYVLMGLVIVISLSLTFILMGFLDRARAKEFDESETTDDKKKLFTRYTKGNYARDVKEFVRLFEYGKTAKEKNELLALCDKIIEGSSILDMYGNSHFTGRLWAGIFDTIKACVVTKDYLNMSGFTSLDLIRNNLIFDVNYYNESETVLGVGRVLRNEISTMIHNRCKYTRISPAKKHNIIRKVNQRGGYLNRLNKYGTTKYKDEMREIINH
jgi:hypothetical protein